MKLAIISLGCPKNQVDADVFCHSLLAAGHTTTADPAGADAIIVNTCAFIESAKSEAIENILDACSYKAQHPALKVIVTGCLAERYQKEIRAEIPEVDAVVGIGSNAALPAILERVAGDETVESYGDKRSLPLGGARIVSTPPHYAYLKIAEGCNNHCTYCAIPAIRGPMRSRPLDDCLAEARWLAGEGVRELIVVAQDPTAYGEDLGENRLCALLEGLERIDGLRWVRLLYAYPERITGELIACMARCRRVLPYLDLPIQHCNDEILQRMGRRSTKAMLLDTIARLRAAIPDITLRTTLIAGFPGETERQFIELCEFVREVRFDRLGCFAYSQEEHTPAARMDGQLDEETKQRRAGTVMRIQSEIMAEKQAEKVGRVMTVLCDGIDEESGLYLCRSAADAPEIDGCVCVASEQPLFPGEFYRVQIDESDMVDLYAAFDPALNEGENDESAQ